MKSCEGGEAVQVLVTTVLHPKLSPGLRLRHTCPTPKAQEVWALQAEVEEMAVPDPEIARPPLLLNFYIFKMFKIFTY